MSWLDWEAADAELLAFTRRLVDLRRRHPVFRRRRFFQGQPLHGAGLTDVGWITPAGSEMTEEDWQKGFAKSLGVFLNGDGIPSLDERGGRIADDSFYVLFNAHHEPAAFRLPARPEWGQRWRTVLATAEPAPGGPGEGGRCFSAGEEVEVVARSLIVLRREERELGAGRAVSAESSP